MKGYKRRWIISAGPDADPNLREVTVRVIPEVNDLRVATPYDLTTVIRGVEAACPGTFATNAASALRRCWSRRWSARCYVAVRSYSPRGCRRVLSGKSRIRPASRKAVTLSTGSAV